MFQFQADSCNELCVKGFNHLQEYGKIQHSDKGDTLYLQHVTTKLTNSKNRYLQLKGRTSSIYAMLGELFWVMSGSSTVDPWLTKFLKRAPIYANNGSWYMAYGPRLYANDQLGGIIQQLIESENTRQAVLSIFDPSKESYQGMKNNLGNEKPNDRSCNNMLYFSIFDKKLELTVLNRSNDVIFGAYSINLPEFTFIQELVAEAVNVNQKVYIDEEDGSLIKPEPIVPGNYIVFSNNYHTYRALNQKQGGNETAQKQFEAVLENYPAGYIYDLPDCNLTMSLGRLARDYPHKIGLNIRSFFMDLISLLSRDLVGREEVHKYLEEHSIKRGSTIWAYSLALYGYLFGQPISEEDCGNDVHFLHILRNSKATKFEILPEVLMHKITN